MRFLFIDFETYFDSKNGYTLRKMPMAAYIRDQRFKVHGFAYAEAGHVPVWLSNTELLSKTNYSDIAIIGQNVKFDGAILAWHFGAKPAMWIDTMAMSKAVLGANVRNHSLATLAEFFKLPAKGELLTDGLETLGADDEARLAEYCKHDVWLTMEIFNRLKNTFPKSQYWFMDWSVKCFIEPKLSVDTNLVEKIIEQEKEKLSSLPQEKQKMFASNVKFAKLLEEKGFEIPVKESPRTGKKIPALALGDPQFLDMLNGGNEELSSLCETRVMVKSRINETRAAKLLEVGRRGNYPFDILFSGASQTHRFSGLPGGGGNPQNFPKKGDLRKAIVAPEGHVILAGDFSSVEARVVAWASGDPRLILAFDEGRDVYCEFASAFYNRKITKTDIAERQHGKIAVLGLGYGAGVNKFGIIYKLQAGKNLGYEDAKKTVDLYRFYYIGVPNYWRVLDELLPQMAGGQKGEVPGMPFVKFDGPNFILPSGLTMKYPGLIKEWDEKGKRQWAYYAHKDRKKEKSRYTLWGGKILENLSQAVAGEICKEAIKKIHRPEWPVVGMIHDSILTVCKKEEAEKRAVEMRQIMESQVSFWPEIKLGAAVGYDLNWGGLKT